MKNVQTNVLTILFLHKQVPKYVFWVDDYPKTASGKIQKFKLKEEGIRMLREGKGEGTE